MCVHNHKVEAMGYSYGCPMVYIFVTTGAFSHLLILYSGDKAFIELDFFRNARPIEQYCLLAKIIYDGFVAQFKI